jgi:hypothetical protein
VITKQRRIACRRIAVSVDRGISEVFGTGKASQAFKPNFNKTNQVQKIRLQNKISAIARSGLTSQDSE